MRKSAEENTVVPFARFAKARLPVATLALPPGFTTTAGVEQPGGAGVPAIDLTGKPKVWFLIGRGRTGKTHLARWVCETAEGRGGAFIVAALDPINRSLAGFRNNVEMPDSSNPEAIRDWLIELLEHAAANRQSVVIDMGGGDTSLALLLRDTPDLAAVLSKGGLEPVAVHVLGCNQSDLIPMALVEELGFQPRATLVVLNEVHGRPAAFESVVGHPLMDKVRGRGGQVVWMPLLTRDTAALVDASHWQFADAIKLGGAFTGSAVHIWLKRMETAFGGVLSWLPD